MATAPRGSFSNANRHMQDEENLKLTSVGVDIGSSTSHLVFSRLELTLEGSRYRVTKREVINESREQTAFQSIGRRARFGGVLARGCVGIA